MRNTETTAGLEQLKRLLMRLGATRIRTVELGKGERVEWWNVKRPAGAVGALVVHVYMAAAGFEVYTQADSGNNVSPTLEAVARWVRGGSIGGGYDEGWHVRVLAGEHRYRCGYIATLEADGMAVVELEPVTEATARYTPKPDPEPGEVVRIHLNHLARTGSIRGKRGA